MGGRRLSNREGQQNLAICTDVKGKSVAANQVGSHNHNHSNEGGAAGEGSGGNEHHNAYVGDRDGERDRLHRTASLNSLSTSTDDQVHTHLSASSAGNDTLSSSGMSGRSTARTSAMLSDDDRPSASSVPTSPSLYAHPNATVLELVSNTASSSALPDSFSFNLSRKGSFISVFTTSTIWLIKAAQLPRLWARTLQVKRKPVAVDILEDGSLLAVLSRPSQVDLYEIQGEADRQIKKRRTIMLVHEAHSMRISPDGLILITGNSFGIEVCSIGPDAPESSRRTLSGPVGDTLEFSDDGRTLLITGYARKAGGSSLFVLPGLYDGPLNEEGEPVPASPEAVWTGLVLFPETTRIARQATLLPDADTGTVNELFAFNSDEDTWGIYDIGAQRFTQRKMFLPDQQRWTRSEFLDDAMPAVSVNADLAAVALKMRGTTSLWIYQVPEWDYKPKGQMPDYSPIQPCFCVPILRDSQDANQEICDLRWVKLDDNVQRLIAVGNVSKVSNDEEMPIISECSKGVMIVLDFDKTKPAGGPAPAPIKMEYDLDPLLPGERLPEGSIDFEREVELVRTRTMAQRRAQTRAGTGRRNPGQSPAPGRSRTTANRERTPPVPTITRDDEEELTMEEAQAAFEAPYDNTQPRSQNSLARAATVAAVSPANRRHLRSLPFRPLEYRRADGLREFPHESDADNWVPPPPAYTASAEESHSVSLSHPNAPPNGAAAPRQPASTTSASPPRNSSLRAAAASPTPGPSTSIPPVPSIPATINQTAAPPHNPYPSSSHHRPSIASQSSSSLTLTPPSTRPTLLHPSTYPSPQSLPQPSPPQSSSTTSHRRRSSSTHNHAAPPSAHQNATHWASTNNQSAYQATSTRHAAFLASQQQPYSQPSTRRPSLRTAARRAVESQIDLRPPPMVTASSVPAAMRRGSAPDAGMSMAPRAGAAATTTMPTRRPVGVAPTSPPRNTGTGAGSVNPNRLSMPLPAVPIPSPHSTSRGGGFARRSLLPRLTTPASSDNTSTRASTMNPLSAPPPGRGSPHGMAGIFGRGGQGQQQQRPASSLERGYYAGGDRDRRERVYTGGSLDGAGGGGGGNGKDRKKKVGCVVM